MASYAGLSGSITLLAVNCMHVMHPATVIGFALAPQVLGSARFLLSVGHSKNSHVQNWVVERGALSPNLRANGATLMTTFNFYGINP